VIVDFPISVLYTYFIFGYFDTFDWHSVSYDSCDRILLTPGHP